MKNLRNYHAYGTWICFECATPYKCVVGTCTIHHGHCDYCKQDKPVTAARDYGYPPLPTSAPRSPA